MRWQKADAQAIGKGAIMNSKIKKIMISVAIIATLLLVATFVSIVKFNVANPFAVAHGLYQTTVADKQYVQIQAYPRVMLAKPQISLESYMETKGFSENKEEQLGALRVFEKAAAKQYVLCSVNRYFSKWHWRE